MQQLSLISATLALTLLVWASADQLITEVTEVSVALTVEAEPDSEWVVTSLAKPSQRFRVTLRGRQADVARLRETGSPRMTLTISDSGLVDKRLGPQSIPLLAELLEKRSEFANCTPLSVSPASLVIHVDRRLEKVIPVVARAGRLEFTVEPRIDPNSVSATLLETDWARVADAQPRLLLNVESDLANQPEDQPVEINVPLPDLITTELGNLDALELKPRTVTVRATVRKRMKTATIQAVPVKFMGSHSLWNDYDIEFRRPDTPETLRVDIIGPADEVDGLAAGQHKLFAVIKLTTPDAGSGASFQFFEPEFRLPPGVKLAPEQSFDRFEIRLIRRNQNAISPEIPAP